MEMTTEENKLAFTHPALGLVAFEEGKFGRPWWRASVELPFDPNIPLDICFVDRPPCMEALDAVAQRVPMLPNIASEGRRALSTEGKAHDFVRLFKQSVFATLDTDTSIRRFGAEEPAKADDARFIESLQLTKVVFFAHPNRMSCHYSIDREFPKTLVVGFCILDGRTQLDFGIQPTKVSTVLEHHILGRLEFDIYGHASTGVEIDHASIVTEVCFEETPTLAQLDVPSLVELDGCARGAMAEHLRRADGDEIEQLDLASVQLVRIGILVGAFSRSVECDYSLDSDSATMLRAEFDFDGELSALELFEDPTQMASSERDESQSGLIDSPGHHLYEAASPSERALVDKFARKLIKEFESSRDEISSQPQDPAVVVDHPALGCMSFEEKHLRRPFWDAKLEIPFESSNLAVDISFFERPPNAERLDAIAQKLSALKRLDGDARRVLTDEDEGREHLRSLATSVFEALDSEALRRRFGVDELENLDDIQFMTSLRLVKVIAFDEPDEPGEPTIILYYSLDGDLPMALDVMFWTFEGKSHAKFSDRAWGPVRSPQEPTTIEHAILGRLEFDADGFATTELTLGEHAITTHVQFSGKPHAKEIEKPNSLLADLVELDRRARSAMACSFARGEADEPVSLYKSHHVEQLRGHAVEVDTFFMILQLVRIGLEVQTSGGTLECDYSIGKESTQYVLCVRFDFDGELQGIALES